ncbi:CDP-alcohol phosphatidyltransferase [Desulfurococcaceae archaeon AG1]|jgi:archaetidylinositol phosphate synthase|nr:CDP-alcohol phosphatidyltransferase [Desulfurococcaceae archaeon AG1]
MLNRIKNRISSLIKPVAAFIASKNIDPNIVTLTGLVLALITPISALLYGIPGAIVMIVLSSILDFLDGEIARVSGRVSARGAFLDSLCDRVSDLSYLSTFIILGLSPVAVYIAAGASLLISYARARAESLGVRVSGVGLMERGERILTIILILLLGLFSQSAMEIALFVFIALSIYTAIERTVFVVRSLGR